MKRVVSTILAVGITTQPALTFTKPTSFEVKRVGDSVSSSVYDVLADGRFIYRASVSDRPPQSPSNPPIQVVLNWFEELKQRVPSK